MEENRKNFAIAVIIIIAIVGAILIFLWGAYFNRGTLSITAQAPFNVLTLEDEFLCDVSPCEIVLKSGSKDIILSKTGYQNITTTVDVKLWSTVDLQFRFVTNPYIETVENYPEPSPEVQYEIVFDDQKNNYKLIKSGDDLQRPIVYFLKEISKPKIFGSENGALIIETDKENSAYKINIEDGKREKLNNDFSKIKTLKLSPNGENFAYTTSDSATISVLNRYNEISQTTLGKDTTTFDWTFDGNLFYVTKVNEDYYFGMFDPINDSYTDYFITQELSALPDEIIPSNNNRKIYFKIGEEKYVLVLE